MRSLSRQKQKTWFAKLQEKLDGIDTIVSYSKPEMYLFTVSYSAGTPGEISAGIVPDYDKTIVSYDRTFKPEEGMVIWVDVAPELDEEGNLIMGEDGITPITPPDYVLKRIIDTQKGIVARYGIAKIGQSK